MKDYDFKAKDGIFRSVCRVCHGGCSTLLEVKHGKLLKVKPDPDSPFNSGKMCIKGLATPEIIYHPSRLLTPLRRDGKRGSNQWKEISWDTALSEIAERLKKIKKESGAESIALGQGTGRHHYMHLLRFANTLGTPNWYEPGLSNCLLPRITVCHLTYGGFVTPDYYGKTKPKTILFWGHNPLITGTDGKLSFAVKKALDEGSFGIAVDPRRSETAKHCRIWIPLRPGTDCALALSMIHILIKEEIYDKEFVEKWTIGFEKLKEHIKPYTPEWAETITSVPKEEIIKITKYYATNKPSVLEWGVAIEQNPNSLQTVRAISLLRALTGNIDIPGGDILSMNILRPYPVLRNLLPKGMLKKRIGGEQFKLLGGFKAIIPSAHPPSLFRAMRSGEPYKIRALLIFGSNPLLTVANTREVYESLMNLELLVVTDLFMTPTAILADYVLPAASWPETNQILGLPLVAENAVVAQQKVVQIGLCRQDEEIMNDLAKRLNLPGSDKELKDILDYRLEPLGLNFEELKEKHLIFPPHQYRKFEERGFKTPSKKVELYSNFLKHMGFDPLPVYKEPLEGSLNQTHLAREYPYILITGSRRPEFFHSEHRQIHSLRKIRPSPIAELHPFIAKKHGISSGDWIYIRTPWGKIKLKAEVTEEIKEGVINIDHGWWFPEREAPNFGVFESNANVLTSNNPPYDSAFGSCQLRGLLCTLEKVIPERKGNEINNRENS